MAGENLSSVFSALSQIMAPDLHRQWNRSTTFLGALAARKGISDGTGKNVAFDVEFTGATAGTVAEGSDVQASEYNSDVNVPAIFSWAHYRSSFQVSETELDAAMSSVGVPQALRDLLGDRILGAGAQLALAIEKDALSGTGVDGSGNPTLVGIYGGALTASGGYGGLNPATYSEWASNVVSNGGVARTLTPDLLAQVDQNIFTASSEPWDLIMTSAGVLRKYESIFNSGGGPNATAGMLQRFVDAARGAPVGTGVPNDPAMQIEAYYKGKPVLRNAFQPAGKLAVLNTKKIEIKYLPRVLTQADKDFMRMMGLEGSSAGNAPIQATAIPARIAVMAKTGDSYKISLKTSLAMAVTRRNACGQLVDISEV